MEAGIKKIHTHTHIHGIKIPLVLLGKDEIKFLFRMHNEIDEFNLQSDIS